MGVNHHKEIREGDEVFCPICGKRWGVNDPYPPKCISEVDAKRKRGLENIAKIRRMFKR